MLNADPSLAVATKNGVNLGEANEQSPVPYLVVKVFTNGNNERSLDGGKCINWKVTFVVVSSSASQASALIDAAVSLFDNQAFSCALGTVIYSLQCQGATISGPVRYLSTGNPLYKASANMDMKYWQQFGT